MYPAHGVALKDFEIKWFSLSVLGSFLWSFNGGYVNGACFAGIWGTGLTHLTGSVTISAVRSINPKAGHYTSLDLLSFVLFFFLGAFVTGIVMGPPKVRWGRLQGALTIVHGGCLLLAMFLASIGLLVEGAWAVSFGMGVQNSITSNWAPFTMRTSHVSGTVLDIGLVLGQMIHSRTAEGLWKLKVHVPNLVAFWIGALVGTISWNHLAERALMVNGIITIFVGVVTIVLWYTWSSLPGTSRKMVMVDDEETYELKPSAYGTI